MTIGAEIDHVIDSVKQSAKYRSVNSDLIRRIGTEQLTRHPKLKEAVKATKNKLHQVCGAYVAERMDYARWTGVLAAAKDDKEALRTACIQMMQTHRSTQERVPILDQFYSELFRRLPPIASIVDIACGLNPLAVPWMNLHEDARYLALDVYDDLADFTNTFFKVAGVNGVARSQDILQQAPTEHADLALVLKAIPCLEQLNSDAGSKLLDAIDADHMVVSYPIHTLTGRSIGMDAFYEQQFTNMVAGRGWTIERMRFDTELAFLVSKAV
nr:FmrO [uncultured bacterium]